MNDSREDTTDDSAFPVDDGETLAEAMPRSSTPRASAPTVPPIAPREAATLQRPSGDVEDHYYWLSNRHDPRTMEYLQAENAYADDYFAAHADLVDAIYREIKNRTQETDQGAPVPVDDWYYVVSTREGAAYPVYRRGRTPDLADGELVLDVNEEAGDSEYFDLGGLEVSPDHTMAAWASDTTGDERFVLKFRNIADGTDTTERLVDTSAAGIAWSNDARFVFYVTPDDAERPCRVWRHERGTPQDDDVEVFHESDDAFYVGIGTTRNERAIIIHTGSKTTSECWLIDPDHPKLPARRVAHRVAGVEYLVDHWGDRLVALTNLGATDFRVVQAPIDDADHIDHIDDADVSDDTDSGALPHPHGVESNGDLVPAVAWTDVVPHQPGRRIAGLEAFADFLALYEWSEGQEQIRVVFRDGSQRVIHLDDQPHEVGFGPNEQWTTDVLRLSHQSLTQPPRLVDVDVRTDETTVVKQRPTPNIDLAAYRSQRIWATSHDGTQVPIDIVYRNGTPLDGTAACTVYGYGAYEISIAPWFSVGRLSLLDRGHVWALVHPRGGGEMGRSWYLDGRLDHKRNTFLDVIAAGETLVERKIASPDRLSVRGGSAGGLLVGACVTMRPELFAAAVAQVPFVDVVTTMSDPTLPLTVTEWEEWGDPRSEPAASYIASYSPYDNTKTADYPALYLTAGLNDPRVGYHEPAKWAAKLRYRTTGSRPILLKTELGAGHGGPSGRYEAWLDEARTLCFIHTESGAGG